MGPPESEHKERKGPGERACNRYVGILERDKNYAGTG